MSVLQWILYEFSAICVLHTLESPSPCTLWAEVVPIAFCSKAEHVTAYTHTHMHTRTHAHMHMHTHTNTQTHTQSIGSLEEVRFQRCVYLMGDCSRETVRHKKKIWKHSRTRCSVLKQQLLHSGSTRLMCLEELQDYMLSLYRCKQQLFDSTGMVCLEAGLDAQSLQM